MKIKILIDNKTKNEWNAEWGLAVWVEYEGHKILLDAGTSGIFTENADSMGVDLSQVEFGVLSHAHYDHSDGLEAFFERNEDAVFYLRNTCAENCYSKKEGTELTYIGIKPGYLETFANRIRYVEGDYEVIPGVTLLPHKTKNLEAIGEHAGMYVKIRGQYHPDSYDHEQSLVFDTEKGLVIFNSCSHGGADNIIREVQETWPEKQIYALIGGLHLFRSTDGEVRDLAVRIRETGIQHVYTGHCTGDAAMEILKEELGDVVQEFYTGFEMTV